MSKDQPQNQFNPAISDFQSALGAKSAKTGYGTTKHDLNPFDSNNSQKPLIDQEEPASSFKPFKPYQNDDEGR